MSLKFNLSMFVVSLIAANQVVHAQETKPLRIVQSLAEKGFKKCNPQLSNAVKWIHSDDSKYAFVTVWNRSAPNDRSAFATTSERVAEGGMVTTFTASPEGADKCSISFTQVFTTTKSCPSVRDETLKEEWKFLLDMGVTAAYERKDEQAATVFLTPSNSGGCLFVKQAVIYY
jgi:hypothetical protein